MTEDERKKATDLFLSMKDEAARRAKSASITIIGTDEKMTREKAALSFTVLEMTTAAVIGLIIDDAEKAGEFIDLIFAPGVKKMVADRAEMLKKES